MKGYTDWQHATGDGYGLTFHNTSASHCAAVLAWEEYKLRKMNSSDVTQIMDNALKEKKSQMQCTSELLLK